MCDGCAVCLAEGIDRENGVRQQDAAVADFSLLPEENGIPERTTKN